MPISDYDRLSVKEILPLLAPLSETELQLVLAHEQATKNRVTLMRTMQRIELSSPPAMRPKAATPGMAAPAAGSAPQPAPVVEVAEDEVLDVEVLEEEASEPAVQAAATAEVAPAKPARGRRSRKLRKVEKAAKAAEAAETAKIDGVEQNGLRRRHPSSGLGSVEPDLEERQATNASRPRLPAIRTRWEDEVPPVELVWELEDEQDELDELAVAGEIAVEDQLEVEVEDQFEGEVNDELEDEDEFEVEDELEDEFEVEDELEDEDIVAAVSDDADEEQEPWGIDDFPDVSDEAVEFENRSVATPTYEVEDSVEDMVPRHTVYAPPPPPPQQLRQYEFDDEDDEGLLDDDVLPARQAPPAAATVTPIRPPAPKAPKAPKAPPAPISAAERVIAQPLPPRPEWMKDEPTQVMVPAVPAQKEPAFKSIKSAVVPEMPKPTLTSVLWVAAAIVAIVVGILIGMVATRTSPPAAVQLEKAAAVTYVAPS